MDPVKIFKEKIGGNFSRKALKSPQAYRLAKLMFVARNPYPFRGIKELTALGLDQTAKAYDDEQKVAFTTAFFPEEIVHALGCVPFAPEVAAATATSLNLSQELLKNSEKEGMSRDACSFHRVAAAGGPRDYFPIPDFFLASSHLCDGAPQLFRYLSQKYDRPYYFLDVPAQKDAQAVEYVAQQLEELIKEVTKNLNISLDEERLKEVIENSNRAREAQLYLNNIRKKYPGILPGAQAINLVYLHFLCQGLEKTPDIYNILAEEIENKASKNEHKTDAPRILWSHLRPFYENDIFTILEQELEVNIVFEEMNQVYWPPLDPAKPYESLARKIINNPLVGPLDYRMDYLKQIIDDYSVDGIIHFSHWGCRHAVGAVPLLKQKAKDLNVAFLNLDADCVDRQNYFSGQVRTRLESFIEMLSF
ncbi:2-hydroxyacyl-CoA dehydratase subunit D [Natranaerobius thermophilus]|uniref:2-hydroxyglutaryl-CoA dehydratase D-component n=1 Tax=Natranaerobius thermophilus (strain ATCC BAA-1301 / DSM 18059 / JW/NM-WN-LF) TaxID=457570 RepID=B2A5I8_NATTJ|nr:2-hydroxyacyl-CoA dehydratase family protein [Natranaerobius thermophilus]ACB85343.1 2-hydroxyglutaryl-CoA dehydratase D-component [Natranaerobius thermophilus JW/NM-WN-LF]